VAVVQYTFTHKQYTERHKTNYTMKLEFSQLTFKKFSNINFMKIHPVGAELFHADKQTDMKKLTVTLYKCMHFLT